MPSSRNHSTYFIIFHQISWKRIIFMFHKSTLIFIISSECINKSVSFTIIIILFIFIFLFYIFFYFFIFMFYFYFYLFFIFLFLLFLLFLLFFYFFTFYDTWVISSATQIFHIFCNFYWHIDILKTANPKLSCLKNKSKLISKKDN